MLQAGFEPGTYGILSTWIWESALDRSATTSKLKNLYHAVLSLLFTIVNVKTINKLIFIIIFSLLSIIFASALTNDLPQHPSVD